MSETLRELYAAQDGYVSDKWEAYFPVYERWLTPYRGRPVSLLEVGVQNGGSLQLWGRYLPQATHVVGCDINPLCGQLQYADPRIHVVVGDVNRASTRLAVEALAPRFDVVIDDGSHRSRDIVKTFLYFYPRLQPGGMYVVEDLHCSYWSRWQGGLWRRDAAMEFFKAMADVVNAQHWGVTLSETLRTALPHVNKHQKVLLSDVTDIESVAFYNSMCVVTKGHGPNDIGGRVVAGLNAPVHSALPPTGAAMGVLHQPRNAKKLKLK